LAIMVRLRYAFGCAAVLNSAAILVMLVASPERVGDAFSPFVFLPLFVVGFLDAPYLETVWRW